MDRSSLENLQSRVEALSQHVGNYKGLLSSNETIATAFSKLQRDFEMLRLTNLDSTFCQKCRG